MHEASASPMAERDLRANKKIHLGKISLGFLVGCFVRAELTNRTRRWVSGLEIGVYSFTLTISDGYPCIGTFETLYQEQAAVAQSF